MQLCYPYLVTVSAAILNGLQDPAIRLGIPES